jgi:hypothetical protein
VKLPVDSQKEGHLVLVNLAPCAGRVIAILEVLGCQNQGGQEHPTSALDGLARAAGIGLLGSKVVSGDMGLNENEVVQSDLECRIGSPRATESLLDEGTQRQDRATS